MASHFLRAMLPPVTPPAHRIPQAVLNHAENFTDKRRGRFIAARILLAELMLKIYGMTQLPELTTRINGRPTFANRELPEFSIAYAGNIIGVLLADEDGYAGLDMEIMHAHSRQTLEYHQQFISSSERAWINAQPEPLEASTQIWTIRQSIVKLTGEGEHGMDALHLHPAAGRLRAGSFPPIQVVSDIEQSLVWSCALSPGTSRLCLWEMEEASSWRSLHDIDLNKVNMGPQALRLTSRPQEPILQA